MPQMTKNLFSENPFFVKTAPFDFPRRPWRNMRLPQKGESLFSRAAESQAAFASPAKGCCCRRSLGTF